MNNASRILSETAVAGSSAPASLPLDAFGVRLNVISRTLRHSNTSVTANHYIKPNLDAVSAGMRQLGEKIAVRNRPDSDQTVISPSGRSAETVN